MATRNPNRWTALEIWENIEKSEKWLYRSILALYAAQTDAEKNSDTTLEDNGIGFNGPDSRPMSRIAKNLTQKGWLYVNEQREARQRLRKYAGQLARLAKDKPGV